MLGDTCKMSAVSAGPAPLFQTEPRPALRCIWVLEKYCDSCSSAAGCSLKIWWSTWLTAMSHRTQKLLSLFTENRKSDMISAERKGTNPWKQIIYTNCFLCCRKGEAASIRHLFVCPMSWLWRLACFYPSPSLIHTVKNSCIFPAKSWEWLNIQIPTLKMEAEVVSLSHSVCVCVCVCVCCVPLFPLSPLLLRIMFFLKWGSV